MELHHRTPPTTAQVVTLISLRTLILLSIKADQSRFVLGLEG
jgi:hypothetical protein